MEKLSYIYPTNQIIKVMAKRSKSLQATLDKANELLALPKVMVEVERKCVVVDSNSERGTSFKQGVCAAIELVLHTNNCYKGFMYLNSPEDESRKYDRKYF